MEYCLGNFAGLRLGRIRDRSLRISLLITWLGSIAAALPPSVHSQIVIESSDLVTLSSDGYSSTVWAVDSPGFPTLQSIFDQIGPNEVFDFSSVAVLPPSTSTTAVLPSANGTPGQDEPVFAGANHVLFRADADAETWTYRTLDARGLVDRGVIILHDLNSDGVTDTTQIQHQPSDTTLVFPLVYGTTWTDAFVRTSSAGGTMNESLQEHDAAVDAWGELITPVGSAPVLRLRETKVSTVDAGGSNVQSILTVVIFYSTAGLSATIIANEAGDVIAGAYSISSSGSTQSDKPAEILPQVGFAYPNPFSDYTTIPIEIARPSSASLRIYDVLGRHVATPFEGVLARGEYHIKWTPTSAAGGVYVVQMQVHHRVVTRLVVQRPH